MNRVLHLTKRNILEIVRDYVSLIFCLGLPIVMLILMSLFFGQMADTPMFHIDNLAPGICVFGYTFAMLYIAITMTADKTSAFMTRILVSPVKKGEYLLSFIFSAIPIMFLQTIIFYIIAVFFGLKINGSFFLSILLLLPSMIFYSCAGVFVGVLCKTDKQAGPFSSIIISGAGLLGGVWMPIELMSETFITICKCLPFYPGILLSKGVLASLQVNYLLSIGVILLWTLALTVIAIFIFRKTCKN